MISCLAIDDEPLALQQLVTYISKVPYLELAAQCQSAIEAREYLEHDTVDAIFCEHQHARPKRHGLRQVAHRTAPRRLYHRILRICCRRFPGECRRLPFEAIRPTGVPKGGAAVKRKN